MAKVTIDYFNKAYWTDGTRSGYHNYSPDWAIHKAIAEMLWTCFDIQPQYEVLDYGGCFGYHAAKLQTHTGCRCCLVDASLYAIAHASRALRGRTYWLDVGVSPLPFPPAIFDFAFSIEVMEHIYKPELSFALTELCRVLRPGALLYVSIDVVRAGGKVNTKTCNDLSHQTMEPLGFWLSQFQKHGLLLDVEATKKVRAFKSTIAEKGSAPLGLCMNWTQVVLRKGPGKI